MRRSVAVPLVLCLVAITAPAIAKFGLTKTRVTLPRTRPPEIHLLGETVTVVVHTESRRVSDRHLRVIQDEVEQALARGRTFRLVAESESPDNLVSVLVGDLEARVRESVTFEERYVKIGERQEWDAKKNRYVTKDVYGNRREPVPLRHATGHLAVTVETRTPAGVRTADAGARYDREFKGEGAGPAEAHSEEALERSLVEKSARLAAGAVVASVDPVEALLAVDGDLKSGNRLAEAGLWKEALAEWGRRAFKGDKEAARLHNMGVAHEALAYGEPAASEAHAAALEQAAAHYRRALALDPQEKYFAEPIERIAASVRMAADARAYDGERAAHQQALALRRENEALARQAAAARDAAAAESARKQPTTKPAETRPRRPAPRPPAPPAEARRPEPARPAPIAPSGGGLSVTASVSQGLRNGSFESGLAPWALAGLGGLAADPTRGKVLRLAGETERATASQDVRLARGAGGMPFSFDYRVLEGAAHLKVIVRYEDGQERPQQATIEVSRGQTAGGWSQSTTDLAAVQPPLARLRSLTVQIDGATVLLDNLALQAR